MQLLLVAVAVVEAVAIQALQAVCPRDLLEVAVVEAQPLHLDRLPLLKQ
jgi:hypothetical protein